jgi:hypothetical protein
MMFSLKDDTVFTLQHYSCAARFEVVCVKTRGSTRNASCFTTTGKQTLSNVKCEYELG